jgi:hypothetical protein
MTRVSTLPGFVQVDVINKVDLKTVALLKRNPGLVIEETKGAQHYTFPMLCDSNEFKNNDIRMAMKHAINRETLLASVLRGYGLVGNDHPIQPGSRFINAALGQCALQPTAHGGPWRDERATAPRDVQRNAGPVPGRWRRDCAAVRQLCGGAFEPRQPWAADRALW